MCCLGCRRRRDLIAGKALFLSTHQRNRVRVFFLCRIEVLVFLWCFGTVFSSFPHSAFRKAAKEMKRETVVFSFSRLSSTYYYYIIPSRAAYVSLSLSLSAFASGFPSEPQMAQFPTTFVIPIVCEFSGETTTTTKMDGKNFSYYTTRTLTRFSFLGIPK